jgi:hypothetical protein
MMKLQRLDVVDYVISSSEYSGSKLYATNPISLEFLSITEFQKWYYCFDTVEQINGNGWNDASFVRGYIMMLQLHEWSQEIWSKNVILKCKNYVPHLLFQGDFATLLFVHFNFIIQLRNMFLFLKSIHIAY